MWALCISACIVCCVLCVFVWYCVTICAFVHVCFLDLAAHIAIGLCAFSGRLSLPSNSLKVLRRYVRKDWREKLGQGKSSRNVNVMGAQMILPGISYEWYSHLVGGGPCAGFTMYV